MQELSSAKTYDDWYILYVVDRHQYHRAARFGLFVVAIDRKVPTGHLNLKKGHIHHFSYLFFFVHYYYLVFTCI